jgi:hypothetical protein
LEVAPLEPRKSTRSGFIRFDVRRFDLELRRRGLTVAALSRLCGGRPHELVIGRYRAGGRCRVATFKRMMAALYAQPVLKGADLIAEPAETTA